VNVEGYDPQVHVQLEQHAGDLSGARRIHRLPRESGGGDSCLVSKWSVNARGVHLNEGVELIAQELLVFTGGHAFQQLE
jgi:hypothetical protein